ncbi:MAG: hypothetical protein KDA25_10915 [Phycisphaerales bacterium]|nr:hypothetical protein [Phycisphaerales bacterium]
MMARSFQPDLPAAASEGPHRLNLLLSYGGWREEPAVSQLPRLLEPMGIRSVEARTGEQAASIIRELPVHIAVVDLALPLGGTRTTSAGGVRTLQLLRRLECPPPVIVIRPVEPSPRAHARGLSDALREGAFSVLDYPMRLETMLEVFRRILKRHYADLWPAS